MGSKKQRNQHGRQSEATFQPIAALPKVASWIDDAIEGFETLYRDLGRARQNPYVLDDATVNRIRRVHTESLENAWIFEEQLARWGKLDLLETQRREVDRLLQQMICYRQSCQRLITLAQELQTKTMDSLLRMSDEEVGRAVLAGQIPFPQPKPGNKKKPTVTPTAEQLHIASLIDTKIKELTGAGIDDEMTLLGEMADFMPGFKRIMDTEARGIIDELGLRFPGFYLYAKILESIARGIQSGKISVP